MDDPETEVLYCDEMKFPLFQTSTHSWTSQLDCYRGVYNRREDDRVLTAIALCSTKGFLGVQVYKQEVTGPDFLYFLNSIIAGLPQTKSYTVLADNASWHHANIVDRSAVSGFIFFNEPRMFQQNIIRIQFRESSVQKETIRGQPRRRSCRDCQDLLYC